MKGPPSPASYGPVVRDDGSIAPDLLNLADSAWVAHRLGVDEELLLINCRPFMGLTGKCCRIRSEDVPKLLAKFLGACRVS